MYILDRCTYTESYSPVHTYTFTGPCVLTGKTHSVTVNAAGLYKYHQGGLIQDCFPDRNVVGIDSLDIIWGLGSFHCLSQQEPIV